MTDTWITFTVPGEAVPQGSMTAFKAGDKLRVVHKNPKGLTAFRSDCRAAADRASAPYLEQGAVQLSATFVLSRPKSHFGSGRNSDVLKPGAPEWHTGQRPDADKLMRSLGDALTGVCWKDDGQLARILIVKRFTREGEAPRTVVMYRPLADESREEAAV